MSWTRLNCLPLSLVRLIQMILVSLIGAPVVVTGIAVRYATYLGGSSDEGAAGVAVDLSGNAYVVGTTDSPDFPVTTGPELQGGQDAYVAKFAPDGTLVYCTLVGGPCEDEGHAITVDAEGNAYLTGRIGRCLEQGELGAGVLVAKLDPTGHLLYLHSFGGSLADVSAGYAIAVDGGGNAYVAGSTSSGDFPTTAGAFRTSSCGGSIAGGFVLKLNPAGDKLVYSTFLCGTDWDVPDAIAIDFTGDAYVAGFTTSHDFPTVNAFQPNHPGGVIDEAGFLCKLDPTGSKLLYSTYLGGSLGDSRINALALDPQGDAFVTGETAGATFPTTSGVLQPNTPFPICFTALCSDAFVTKFSSAGALLYSTYLGGEGNDGGTGIAVEDDGTVIISGWTASIYFPIRDECQVDNRGLSDVFVTKLNSDASRILFSTYLGGGIQANSRSLTEGSDDPSGMALSLNGDIYLAGYTSSLDFPTTSGVFQPKPVGGECFLSETCGDAFVARLTPKGAGIRPALRLEVSPEEVIPGATVTATWSGILRPSANDQLQLFPLGQSSDGVFLQASYSTAAAAAGTLPLVLPAQLAAGAYELRLMTPDSESALLQSTARSQPITVVPSLAANPRLIATREPGNIFRFLIGSALTQTCQIVASGTLDRPNWQVIGTFTPGAVEFRDKIDLTSRGRFYRLSSP